MFLTAISQLRPRCTSQSILNFEGFQVVERRRAVVRILSASIKRLWVGACIDRSARTQERGSNRCPLEDGYFSLLRCDWPGPLTSPYLLSCRLCQRTQISNSV